MLSKSLSVSYIDFLWALCAVFLLLFITAKQEEQKAKGNIVDPSVYIIEMTWEDGSQNDIDLWVENPAGKTSFFTYREIGGMTLDTDNLGTNNKFTDAQGNEITNPKRREVVSIRAPMAGVYTVNVMMFTNNTLKDEKVKVHVFKTSPYSDVIDKEVILTTAKEEKTILQFELNDEFKVVSIDDQTQVSLVERLQK